MVNPLEVRAARVAVLATALGLTAFGLVGGRANAQVDPAADGCAGVAVPQLMHNPDTHTFYMGCGMPAVSADAIPPFPLQNPDSKTRWPSITIYQKLSQVPRFTNDSSVGSGALYTVPKGTKVGIGPKDYRFGRNACAVYDYTSTVSGWAQCSGLKGSAKISEVPEASKYTGGISQSHISQSQYEEPDYGSANSTSDAWAQYNQYNGTSAGSVGQSCTSPWGGMGQLDPHGSCVVGRPGQ